MKKYLLVFFVLIFNSFNTYSFEISGRWTQELEHLLVVNCAPEELMCMDLCNKQSQCKIAQPVCRSCIGTGLFLTQIFQSLTDSFGLEGAEADQFEFISDIKKNKFVTIEANSPFNMFDDSDSKRFERELDGMCGQVDSYPLLIGSLNSGNELTKLKYLVCHYDDGARILKLNQNPAVRLQVPYSRLF
jgi:hypothetical protein